MTNKNLNHYEKLALLFEYPDADYPRRVKEIEIILSNLYPGTFPIIKEFANYVSNASPEELEELFARTFDVQAITTLDIGYVLFGDDYKRGELLVNLNREHKEAGNDCGNELADNLSNLLRLLPKMQNTTVRDELVEKIFMPALSKILNEFNAENINLKNKIYRKQYKTLIEQSEDFGRIYLKPLTVIYKILEEDFNYATPTVEESKNNFTKSIITEIEID